jgi:hypothetical protein
VKVPAGYVLSLNEGYMLLTVGDVPLDEGRCVLPIPIPSSFDLLTEAHGHSGEFEEILFRKEAILEEGGSITIRNTIRCARGSDLSHGP